MKDSYPGIMLEASQKATAMATVVISLNSSSTLKEFAVKVLTQIDTSEIECSYLMKLIVNESWGKFICDNPRDFYDAFEAGYKAVKSGMPKEELIHMNFQ